MNFESLPGQLTTLMLGWGFVIYNQHRSNVRAEAIKTKDKVIDRLLDLPTWISKEIERKSYSPAATDEAFSGLVTRIELMVTQITYHSGVDMVSKDEFAQLRSAVEFELPSDDLAKLPYKVHAISLQIISELDESFHKRYFSPKWPEIALRVIHELSGACFGLLVIILLLLVFKLLGMFSS